MPQIGPRIARTGRPVDRRTRRHLRFFIFSTQFLHIVYTTLYTTFPAQIRAGKRPNSGAQRPKTGAFAFMRPSSSLHRFLTLEFGAGCIVISLYRDFTICSRRRHRRVIAQRCPRTPATPLDPNPPRVRVLRHRATPGARPANNQLVGHRLRHEKKMQPLVKKTVQNDAPIEKNCATGCALRAQSFCARHKKALRN